MARRIAKVSPLKVGRKKEEGLGPSGTGEYLRTRIPQREGGAGSFDSLLSDMEIRVLMERLEQTTRRLTLFPAETIDFVEGLTAGSKTRMGAPFAQICQA